MIPDLDAKKIIQSAKIHNYKILLKLVKKFLGS
jgi:hypothetical protein